VELRASGFLLLCACTGGRTGLGMHSTLDASIADAPIDVASDARPPCTPQSCKGCCDATGECRDGNSLDACGVQGQACEICAKTPDSLCNKPVPGCVLQLKKCSAASCGGCCIRPPMSPVEYCSVTGRHVDACGHGWELCQACMTCKPFTLMGGTCQ